VNAEYNVPFPFQISPIISGGVLQYGEEVNVWGGGAHPSADVKITLHTEPFQSWDAVANQAGDWILKVPAQPVGWNITLSAVSDGQETNTTVSFGVVILCAGQSNMDMPVACHYPNKTKCFHPKLAFHADNGTAECASAGDYTDRIWLIKAVQTRYSSKPTWKTVTSDTLAPFSAVCWYTGKYLYEDMGGTTPVGLMQTSVCCNTLLLLICKPFYDLKQVGGSPIEYWLPPTHPNQPNINTCERDIPQCDNQVRVLGVK
jgi:hypothetical protein